MNKRGQLQLSFGMIFSILIIVFTIAIAAYVIISFMGTADCSKIGTFYNSFQEEVDKAWNAEISQKTFTGTLPTGISEVCFGNLTLTKGYEAEFEKLNLYSKRTSNLFLYPPEKACKGLGDIAVKHVYNTGFFCIDTSGGQIKVSIKKSVTDKLVRISK